MMRIKKIIGIHAVIALLLAVAISIAMIVTDSSGEGVVALVFPIILTVVTIGYFAPLVTGLLAVSYMQKTVKTISHRIYLISYYVLVAWLFLLLYMKRDEADSGFAILLLPYLPIGALIITIAWVVIIKLFRGFNSNRI